MGIQEFNRQDIIDKIIEHMIDILVIDYNNVGATTQDKRNIDYRLTTSQSWVQMYPYYTETASIMGIKPISIYTS